jgi:archaemetzincin
MRYFLLSLIILFIQCDQQKPKSIAIQNFGNFPPALTDSVVHAIQKFYGFQTLVLDPVPIPENYFVQIKTPRYRADSIIRFLKECKPRQVDYIIGLTTEDISTTKRDAHHRVKQPVSKYADWGVFGLGYRPGPSCVVSTHRIFTKSKEVNMARLKKICLHEIGHNLGLPHCPDKDCFMQDANESIKTIDGVDIHLCEKCAKKIRKFR